MPVIKKLLSQTQDIDLVIIGADVYHTACYLKKVQVFAI